RPEPTPDELHAAFDVQRGPHAGERQAELDQRDRHGRPHSDDDGLGVEDARDGGDVVEHAPDEAVDDLERRDVDEHALRAVRDDLAGEVFFERGGEAVVHVHLDGDEQRVPELQDRDTVHRHSPFSAGFCGLSFWAALALTTERPVRLSATAKASASVALEMTLSSTPRWTIVCAICGRMPLMMQSAPIRRAAETVLSKCCAVSVSTVGTPVMSMIAISAPSS